MRLPPFSPQTSAMSGEDWGDSVPVEAPTVEVKLFGKWSPDEVHVNDISLAVSFSTCDIIPSCILRALPSSSTKSRACTHFIDTSTIHTFTKHIISPVLSEATYYRVSNSVRHLKYTTE